MEVIKKRITVNALALGYIDAGMFHSLSPEIRETIIKNIPSGIPGNPDHLAELIVFLASDFADYVTGQVINVDGGVCL
jgi:3-oxoacyl-[acyl-carrier protein] reductase